MTMTVQRPVNRLRRIRSKDTLECERSGDPRLEDSGKPYNLTEQAYRVILYCRHQSESTSKTQTGRPMSAKTETLSLKEEVKS